ncbi:hypothetical protein ACFWIW_10925 [Amycolatopsis sp. NPDC058340]|uniref:hypothetical protein n=1 Tax=Amycolatopsis sp. NPDC058340 TaxID=3346453 RepID=UPI0036585E57
MTDLRVLHEHGLTHHQTGPLRSAGYDTAEAIAELVEAHRADGEASVLAQLPGMGPRRLALVCAAVDSWRAVDA